jgi:hypothetical protein
VESKKYFIVGTTENHYSAGKTREWQKGRKYKTKEEEWKS